MLHKVSTYCRRLGIQTAICMALTLPWASHARAETEARFPLPPIPAHIETSSDPRDVVLRFDAPVDEASLTGIAATWPELVEYVSAGYDQVLVRGKVSLHAELQGRLLKLTAQTAAAISSEDQAARDAKVRRELMQARVDAFRGDDEAARQRLNKLNAENGNRADVLSAIAENEMARGAWRPARDLYRRASALDRDNEYLVEATREAGKQAAPFTRLEYDVANVKGGERQSIAVLQGQAALGERTDAGVIAERRRLQTGNAADLGGRSYVADEYKERLELYVLHQFESLGQGRAALLKSGDGTTGAALGYAERNQGELSGITITYHRPYWELVSGLVNRGTQDQVEARHERDLGDGWSANMALRYNRYGVADDDDVTKSAGLLAALRYNFALPGRDLSVGYGLDGEYIHTQQLYSDANGVRFRPLSIGTKEIHSLDIAYSETLFDVARLDAYAGYAYDRYNDKGAFVGLGLAMLGGEAYEIGLRASHAKALSRGEANDVNRAGAYGLLRF